MSGVERRRTLATALLWCVAVGLGLKMAGDQARVVDQRANGFVAYYTSARLLTEGEDPVRFYDRAWFQGHIARFEPTVLEIFSANPPTMSVLLLPLSSLGYYEARAVWVAFSFAVVIATTAWLLTALRISGFWAPAFTGFVFLYQPLVSTLDHGQFYALGLALLAVVFHGYRTGRDPAIGVPLGFLLATKTAGLLIWPLLAVGKRWRAMTWAVAVAAVTVAVSWPWIGAAAWGRYLSEAAELTRNPLLAVTAYQTVFGFFHHLFGQGGDPIGAPVIALPALATALSAIVGGGLLIATVLAARRSGTSGVMFAAFVLLGLILTPVTGASHFTLALLPIAVLVAEAQRRGARYAVLVIAGAVLIAADLPYRSPRLADGLLAMVAYPKLYGTLLLWWLALWTALERHGIPIGVPGSRFSDRSPSPSQGGALLLPWQPSNRVSGVAHERHLHQPQLKRRRPGAGGRGAPRGPWLPLGLPRPRPRKGHRRRPELGADALPQAAGVPRRHRALHQ